MFGLLDCLTLPAPRRRLVVVPSDRCLSDTPVLKTTHVYRYISDTYGAGTIMLNTHGSEDSQTIEYMSRSGLSDVHGHWTHNLEEGILRVAFNCRQGAPASSASSGTTLPLHLTVFWLGASMCDDPDADWSGFDDKGCCCFLTHLKSTCVIMQKGKAPKWELVRGLHVGVGLDVM